MVAIEKLIGQSIPHVEGIAAAEPTDTTATPAGTETERPRQSRGRHGAKEGSRERSRENPRDGAQDARKPRREREPRRGGGDRHAEPKPQQAPVAEFTPPSAPPPSRTPSIGRAAAPQNKQDAASEPADHSHLPAFLLRPVRARV
jgi:hypothetical protein